MSTGLIIVMGVLAGLAVLFSLLALVYARVRKNLEKQIARQFDAGEIVLASVRANFLGIQSRGGTQIRGNGALVLTRDALCVIRAVPPKEMHIPLQAIGRITLPRQFNGRSVMARLLCVSYDCGQGDDAVGVVVKNPEKWKQAIENLIRDV